MFYTGAFNEACVVDAIDAGPEGFVLKSDTLPALRQAVRAVSAGAFFWTSGAKDLRDKRRAALRRCSGLSDSERNVLKLIAAGNCTKEIASALRRSEHTVSHQRQSIMDKLQIHSAVALGAFARNVGLVN